MTTPTIVENPLKQLTRFGQSIWLDYIRRSLMTSGELKRLIEQDGLGGMTSNPTIFEKAITGGGEYADQLAQLRQDKSLDAKAIYERLAIRDIQDAADILRPVYEGTRKRDGFVSLEVAPFLANETLPTIEEARRLWKTVDRPNVMIKVPGTAAGLPAIETLLGEGININITLLFSQVVYEEVALAYIRALEKCVERGIDLAGVASVASFFVSRIDTLVDSRIDALLPQAAPGDRERLESLRRKVAIANAKLAYERYQKIFSGVRWEALKGRGAQTQRVLWASTSTKNPTYSDILYIEELIGPDTVNTIPPATYDAFRDHGKPRASLEENIDQARQTMADLPRAGISMKEVTDQLTEDGVKLFAEAFDKLLEAVEKSSKKGSPSAAGSLAYKMPDDLARAVQATIDDWKSNNKVQRLWARDASLWTNADESKWLGWLGITEEEIANRDQFKKIADEIRSAGFKQAVLLGMGGSSRCVEVLKLTFGDIQGYPEFFVIDSTSPGQIKAVESKLDLAHTLFIVSSKSGSTLEPNTFKQYSSARVTKTGGAAEAGKHFIAITDPGSHMQKVAESDHFRHVFFGLPSIGGRYSALSDFGMIPGAIQGVDIPRLLDHTEEMVHACVSAVPADQNPGVVLGAILGT